VIAHEVPTSGSSPSLPNAGTIRARSEAIARSQVNAQASPTPAAGPLMAAMKAVSLRAILQLLHERRAQRACARPLDTRSS
jgi:hypothetical protein